MTSCSLDGSRLYIIVPLLFMISIEKCSSISSSIEVNIFCIFGIFSGSSPALSHCSLLVLISPANSTYLCSIVSLMIFWYWKSIRIASIANPSRIGIVVTRTSFCTRGDRKTLKYPFFCSSAG